MAAKSSFYRMRYLFALALLPLLAAAQTTANACRDDNGRDRCASDEQAKARALFGVKAIEVHAAASDTIRRVFYVDGYGGDLIVISAVRIRGRSPELRVDFPSSDRRIAGPLAVPLPLALWREIDTRTASLPWTPPPSRSDPSGELSICLHSWVYMLEAATPGVRRVTEDACRGGLGQGFARWLADATVPLFPHCAALDKKKHRNSATLLRRCGMLSGRDRMAAAHAMNGAYAFSGIGGERDAARLAPYFAPTVAIDWTGQRPEPADAPRFWSARMGPGDGSVAHLYVDRVEGLAFNRVRLIGKLGRNADTPRGRATGSEQATVEQLWTRQPDGVFRIERARVGPWQPQS